MIELSLNEVESLAGRVARGSGYSQGLADDVALAARRLAAQARPWPEALERLAAFAATTPSPPAPMCPVRLGAYIRDVGAAEFLESPVWVGLPIWLDAMVADRASVSWPGGDLVEAAHVRLSRDSPDSRPVGTRAEIAPSRLESLRALAHRVYVPESETSRARGAGGGRVDDD